LGRGDGFGRTKASAAALVVLVGNRRGWSHWKVQLQGIGRAGSAIISFHGLRYFSAFAWPVGRGDCSGWMPAAFAWN